MIEDEKNPVFTDVNAESLFLGSIFFDVSVYPAALEIVPDSSYFSMPEHGHIYDALADMSEKGQGRELDLVLIRDTLVRRNRLAAAGGAYYLEQLASRVCTDANLMLYAEIVRKKYLRRRALEIHQTAIAHLGDAGVETEDVVAAATDSLSGLFESGNDKSHSLLSDIFSDMEKSPPRVYISSGFQSLDDFFLGLGQGNVIIVAGRPGMGKTSFMLGMAYNLISEKDTPAAFFSLEMPREKIAERILCQVARVSNYDIYKKWLPEDRLSAIDTAKKVFSKHRLVIDGTRGLTTEILRQKIFSYQRRYGVKVAFVDYLQLLQSRDRTKDLYTKVCMLSHELKSIAMSLDIPIVVGCQLNRAVEGRPDKRPRMSDLRDSGKIEEDADLILMPYRPDYHKDKEKESPMSGSTLTETAQIIIEKNRETGKTGMVEMNFYKDYGLFEDIF